MAVSLRWDLPPAAALDFFRRKGLRPSFDWQDMLHQEHDAAFTVAKMMDLDLLRDVREAVDRALAEGQTLRQFREGLQPLLMERGWWGRAEMVDPLTGEIREVQLGSPRRLRTIFRTNLRTAYAAGHWRRIADTAERAPYLLYDAVLDDRTRPDHRRWDGKVLRWDDPWWQTHYPPNGWNCRCTVIQLNERQLRRLGRSGPDRAPEEGDRQWINPRTGESHRVPRGIDPGWGYHPGRSRTGELRRQIRDKAAAAPHVGAPAAAKATEPRPPAGIFTRRDQVYSRASRVTQESVDQVLREVPGITPRLEKVRRFLDAHPQKALFIREADMQQGAQARGQTRPIVEFLGGNAARYGINNHSIPRARRVNGFTALEFDHVVVKVRANDNPQSITPAQLREGVAEAIRRARDGRRFWNMSAATAELAGQQRSFVTTFVHELGHQVHFWGGAPLQPSATRSATRYAGVDKREWHAEHFAAWLLNRDALAEFDPRAAEHFDELIEQATLSTEKGR